MAYESGKRQGDVAQRCRRRETCLCAELARGTDLGGIVRKASVQQLRRLWRLAGEELRAPHLPNTLAVIVELRRLALEELESRDPEAFECWLAGQPRPTGPWTYVTVVS